MATTTFPARTDLVFRPITTNIGVEVTGVELGGHMSPDDVAAIRSAWLKWRVAVFPGQDGLDRGRHVAFGRLFGQVTPAHRLAGRPADQEHPEIYVLDLQELRRTYPSFQGVPDALTPYKPAGSEGWHTDLCYEADPPLGSMLRAIAVPEYGGDTMFANLAGAYAALAPATRDFLSRLRAVHRIEHVDNKAGTSRIESAAVHPVVHVHPETGEAVLFVNPGFTSHIVGLSRTESDSILQMCFEVITSPEFVLRVRWNPNTLVFWDNRATCHFGPIEMGNANYHRVMNRITIKGVPLVGMHGDVSETII